MLVRRLAAGQEGTLSHSVFSIYYLFSMHETTALSICCRSEQKIWSPLVTEEGKRHPYRMNLASEPQVSTCPPWPLLSAPRGLSAFDTAGHTRVFPALEAGDRTQWEGPPLTLLGPGSCLVLPVRELREEGAGKPQGSDARAWAGHSG